MVKEMETETKETEVVTVVHTVCGRCWVDLCCSGSHPCNEPRVRQTYVLA